MTLRQTLSKTISAMPRGMRWRTRRTVALLRWFGQRAAGRADSDSYTRDFWDLHRSGDWPGFADVILRFCAPASLVDVGCGDGKLLSAIRARDASMPLLGIDGSDTALARAALADVAFERRDLASLSQADRDVLRRRIAAFDVVVSLETAEHLAPWKAARFVDTIAAGRLIVFSAAQPDQGGTLHLNERPPEYWRGHFARRGYQLSAVDAAFRDALGALDLPWWYAANVHLYERRS